ncbi:MAG: VOC family protein [Thermoanaerobaculales bacterium]|jgi:methylmalonyl-CoA/ethylmalonyl-CoA epimerase|nr:VOC family protein [Thermoanaerobaculales bacterium]
MSTAPARRLHHLDVVVRDLDRASARYRQILGVEPLPREAFPERGIDLVRFRVGETWLILVQPTDETGPVAGFLAEHGEGFFHMAVQVDDAASRARDLAGLGIRLATTELRTGVDGWKLVDVEIDETFGAMIQLVEDPAAS